MLSFGGQRPSITYDWRVIAVSGALLIMSFLLATGREWTRRILLIGVILVGAFLLFRYGIQAIGPISFTDLSPDQMPTVRLWTRLGEFSSFFLVLALSVFAVLFLCHPDVVASFRSGVPPREKV
ncbi:MAG: hypothetical protein H0W20_14145 [Chthoniobacterales bacterium]|nr:hypothetical protein [Chthoniobacterales bacterium]